MSQDVQIVPVATSSGGPLALPGDYSAPPQPPQNPLVRLQTILRGRWKWAIGLAVAGAIIGVATGYFAARKPQYRSVGLIQIKPVVNGVIEQQRQQMPMFDQFVESQAALMRSRRIIDLAMDRPEWRELKRGKSDDEIVEFTENLQVVRQGITVLVSYQDHDPVAAASAVKAVIRAYKEVNDDSEARADNTRRDALTTRQTNLTSDISRLRTRIYKIAADDGGDNSTREPYTPESLARVYALKLEELQKLEAELRNSQISLTMAEAMLIERGINAGPATAPATNPADAAAPADPADPAAPIDLAAAAAPATAPAAASAPAVAPVPQRVTLEQLAATDPQVRELLRQRADAQRSLSQLDRLGQNHPLKVTARIALQSVQEQIDNYMAEVQNRAAPEENLTMTIPGLGNVSIEQLRARERNLRALYEKLRNETLELGRRNLEITTTQQEIDTLQKRLDEVRSALERIDLENSATLAGRVNVLDEGDRPLEPYTDRRKLFSAAGGMAGLSLGFGIVLLIGLLDTRVKNFADARTTIRNTKRVLGILPTLPDNLANPEEASLAAYCVHHIRTLLQLTPGSAPQRAIAITSPASGDGKTSLTLALGLSFAAAGSRTLMIDCDVVGGGLTKRMNAIIRRKIGDVLVREGRITADQLHQALIAAQHSNRRLGEILIDLGYLTEPDLEHALSIQSESRVGLLDVLDGDPLEACVSDTGTPGMDILPLGAAKAYHAGQLSPRALRSLIEEARKIYDIVLIDTGPVLGSLEASIVAAEADEVVLTVPRGQRRPMAEKAIDHLESIGAHLAGVVFNRASTEDLAAADMGSAFSAAPNNPPAEVITGNARLGPVAHAVSRATTNQR